MANVTEVVDAANRLAATKDDKSLVLLLGMIDKEITNNPQLKDTAYLDPKYDAPTMGALDDLKAVGLKILKRWNKELQGLVCGSKAADQKEREQILNALSIGQTAVIGAVAAALLGLGVPPPIAAALAPLIVKQFIWPAKDELCQSWAEMIKGSN